MSIAPDIKQKRFSWSLRRERLFNSCHLAYLFNYHLSYGGQLHYAEDRCRHLYRLKHIHSADNWLQGIIADTLRHTFNCGQNYATYNSAVENFRRQALEIFHHDWYQCMAEQWRDDPKNSNIFEIYYGGGATAKALFAAWLAKLEDWLKTFIANSLFEKMWKLDSLKWRQLETPAAIDLGDIHIWLNPILAWHDHNYGAMLIFSQGADKLNSVEISLASILLGQKTYLPIGRQEIMLYPPGGDDIFVRHPVEQELEQSKIIINESSSKMREFEHNVVCGMSVKGQQTVNCIHCNFLEFCQNHNFFHNGIQ